MHDRSLFGRIARGASRAVGQPLAFGAALAVVITWALAGPALAFSDTWQLTINTGTTIVTFLMVFLIQNTQNRDSLAVHLKLDELLRAVDGAHNALLDLEELTQSDLDAVREGYAVLAELAREAIRRGEGDTGSPEIAAP